MSFQPKAFHDTCHRILTAAARKEGGENMYYAASYARRGLQLQSLSECATQSLYILTNITYWRTEEAKAVRFFLNNLIALYEASIKAKKAKEAASKVQPNLDW